MVTLTEKAKKLIDSPNLASVATLMPDGSPQVAPVWVDREEDIIVLNRTLNRQGYRNLQRDPRVALCIYDRNSTGVRVLIRGRVIEMTEEGASEHADKMSLKYTGNPKYQNYENNTDARVIIRIEPEHLTDGGTWR